MCVQITYFDVVFFADALVNGRLSRNLTGEVGGMFIAQKVGYK